MISYSQNLEDVVLDRLFRGKDNGFYIDVGTFDPVKMSVNKHFYDRGWHGINIEPAKEGFELISESRPRDINLNIALGEREGLCPFYKQKYRPEFSGVDAQEAKRVRNMLSGVILETSVKMKKLSTVCMEYDCDNIDFLKIDVCGCEYEVIRGADFKQYRPTVVVVDSTRDYTRWEPLLLEADYEFLYYDGLNRYYLKHEESGLRERLVEPVCPVNDNYTIYVQGRPNVQKSYFDDVREEIEVLKNNLKFYVSQDDFVAEKLKNLTVENNTLVDSLETVRSEKRVLRARLSSAKNIIIDMEERISSKNKKLRSLASSLESLMAEVDMLKDDRRKFRKAEKVLKVKSGLQRKFDVLLATCAEFSRDRRKWKTVFPGIRVSAAAFIEPVLGLWKLMMGRTCP